MPDSKSKLSASSINIEKLTEAQLPKAVITLAWPVVLEMTFFGLGGIINTILVGRLGAASLAAVGLAQQLEFMMSVIFAAVGVGATALIARHIGAGEGEQANRALNQTFIMAVLFGILFTIPAWIYAYEAMIILKAKPDVALLGVKYIKAVCFSVLPAYILFAGCSCIRGAGNTRTPMIIIVGTTICNIIFGYLLIYGGLGFPALGVLGAGIAAALSRAIGALAVLAILLKGAGPLQYRLSSAFAIDTETMKRIFKIGLPAGLEQIQFQLALTIYTVILSSLGTSVIAAHAVAMRIENLAFMPGFGFGVAAMTLVGQSVGAQRTEIGEKAAYMAERYAMIVMTAVGVFLFIFGRHVASLFITDAAVIGLAAFAMKIWAFGMPLMGKSNTLAGGLRGAGDTRWVLFIMAFSSWVLRLPLAFLLAHIFHLGAAGAWTAAIIDINTRGLLMWWRFRTGKWKTIQV